MLERARHSELFGAQQPGRLFHRKRKTGNLSQKRFRLMKKMKIMLSLVMVLGFSLGNLAAGFGAEAIKLPPPATKGTVSVEEALQNRRSTRKFANRSLELAQVSQLLWAADG